MSLLEVSGVHLAYGKVRALDGVSLTVETGEVVALIGANGAGKSSLMRAIMGLVPTAAGQITFAGQVLRGRRTHEMVRLGIAYVPEGRGVLRALSVRENLVLGAFARRWDGAARHDMERVLGHFPVLARRLPQAAGTLSGGEQQMLVIARALMARPTLMLLDEPTLGLAPLIARDILARVRALAAEGVTVLLVEQNARAVLRLARRGYVLEMGRIVLEGEDLAGNPRVRAAYLGEIEGVPDAPP